MKDFHEKRSEQRLKYDWLIRFGKDFQYDFKEGRMYDLSSESACFVCKKDASPRPSDKIVLNFTIPRLSKEYRTEGISFTRSGIVCKVEGFNEEENRIIMRFDVPLDVEPAGKTAHKIHH